MEDRDVITGGKDWLKCVKTIVHNSFRKIRITDQKENIGVQRLLSKRNGSCDNTVIDVEITEKIYERNRNIILDQVHEMSDQSGNMSRINMWKIKQKVHPKYEASVPVAKKG